MSRVEITPSPSPEEAAAIVAVLRTLETRTSPPPKPSRWKLAGRNYGQRLSW